MTEAARSYNGRYSAVIDELSGTIRKPFTVKCFHLGYLIKSHKCRSKKAARKKMQLWIGHRYGDQS